MCTGGVIVSVKRRVVLWSHLPRRFANSSNHHEFERTRLSDLRVERSSYGDVNQREKCLFYGTYTPVFVVQHAIMSLMPIRRRPPVSEYYIQHLTIHPFDAGKCAYCC
jgi:hypothetical protein